MFAELFSYDNELRAEGEARGSQAEKVKIAVSLLPLLDDETITNTTGLPLEEVQELRQTHGISN